MVIALRAVEHRPVRVIVREFIEAQIEDQDEIRLDDLRRTAHVRFQDDSEMHAALLTDALDSLVSDVLNELIRSRRTGEHFYRTEAGYVSNERIELGAREIFARIFESVGDGRRKSLLSCTKGDLEEAIEGRNKMIDGLSRYNEFLSALARPLKGSETVGDHYQESELQARWQRLRHTHTEE